MTRFPPQGSVNMQRHIETCCSDTRVCKGFITLNDANKDFGVHCEPLRSKDEYILHLEVISIVQRQKLYKLACYGWLKHENDTGVVSSCPVDVEEESEDAEWQNKE